MRPPVDKQTRHFQIGIVPVSLTTSLRGLHDEYTSLYRDFLTTRPHTKAVHVEVQPKPISLRHRRRYNVTVNGRLQFEPTRADGFLPYIEWAVNWEIAQLLPQYLHLHAASVETGGVGVILPGTSGSGKSTLTAGLLARGWRYLCDEFAMIHAGTLALHPYPRAICIKEPCFPVIDSLGFKLHGNRVHVKGAKGLVGFINPLRIRPDAIGRICPIRYVIFPTYTPGAKPALVEISRAEAAFALHEVCFNPLACQALATDVLTAVIRPARCYRLTCGDLNATCDLVQTLVESAQQVRAISASSLLNNVAPALGGGENRRMTPPPRGGATPVRPEVASSTGT